MRLLKRGYAPPMFGGCLLTLYRFYEAHIKKLPTFVAPQTVARHVMQTLDQLDVKKAEPGTSAGPESIALRGSMAVYGYQRRWVQRVANSTIIAIRVILQCLTCEHLVRNLVACTRVPTYHNTHAGIASHTSACSLKHRGVEQSASTAATCIVAANAQAEGRFGRFSVALKQLSQWPGEHPGDPRLSPIETTMSEPAIGQPLTIVSGLPRSGTSMMMRMLDTGGLPVMIDRIREADEDNPNGYYEFEAVKQTKEDPGWLEESDGKVVKMVYRLLYDLPENRTYNVLFMARDLDEVLASQRVMLERSGAGSDEITDDQMRMMFQSEIDRFNKWIAERPAFRMIRVDYNALMADPATELAKVNEFLGGRLDVPAMTATVDKSLYRNRKAEPAGK